MAEDEARTALTWDTREDVEKFVIGLLLIKHSAWTWWGYLLGMPDVLFFKCCKHVILHIIFCIQIQHKICNFLDTRYMK